MKSKFKKLMVAAAVSFAFAAPASAAITSGLSSAPELFLSAYDTGGTTNNTFIYDLNIALPAFGTQNRTLAVSSSVPAWTNIADDSAADNLSLSVAGANWTSFLSSVSNVNNVIWDIIAVDGSGTSASDRIRAVFTSATDVVAALAAGGVQQTNGGVSSIGTIVDGAGSGYIANVNAAIGSNTSVVVANTDPATYGGGGRQNVLGGGLQAAVTSAGLGQSMGFYYLTRSDATDGNEAFAAAYKLAGGQAFQWTLSQDGSLTYAVAAVPEPTTWALFAAGALMLGGMARRRLS